MSNLLEPENNNKDEASGQRLSQDILTALDKPTYRSRRAEIMTQVRIEQAQRLTPGLPTTRTAPRRTGMPVWAGTLAAGLGLFLITAVVVLLANFGPAANTPAQSVAVNSSASTATAQESSTGNSSTDQANAGTGSKAAATTTKAAITPQTAGAVQPGVNAPLPAAAAATTAAATMAAAATTAAAVAAAPAPAATNRVTTAAAAATTAATSGGASVAQIPATAQANPKPNLTLGGLPMYPGTAVINVPSDNIKNYLMSLPTTQGFDRKLANRLDEVAGFNFEASAEFNTQFSTRPINPPVTANQVADFYQNEGQKAGYKLTQFSLANDSKLNVLWLLQEKPGASFGILIVEVKDAGEANRIFGGKFNPGDSLIFFTPLA